MRYFARICAHARSWHEFAKCRFAHFPSFFSVHVDTYATVLGFCKYTYESTKGLNMCIDSHISLKYIKMKIAILDILNGCCFQLFCTELGLSKDQ